MDAAVKSFTAKPEPIRLKVRFSRLVPNWRHPLFTGGQ